jgi:hypothetical protein
MRWWRIFATADEEPDTTHKIRRLKRLLVKERDDKRKKELAARVVSFPEGARWDLPQSGNRITRTVERR